MFLGVLIRVSVQIHETDERYSGPERQIDGVDKQPWQRLSVIVTIILHPSLASIANDDTSGEFIAASA